MRYHPSFLLKIDYLGSREALDNPLRTNLPTGKASLHPVGEQQNQTFQLSLNTSLKVHFHGPPVTSDGALRLVRELFGERRGGLLKYYEREAA
jgi:hypothetical protein